MFNQAGITALLTTILGLAIAGVALASVPDVKKGRIGKTSMTIVGSILIAIIFTLAITGKLVPLATSFIDFLNIGGTGK